VADITMCKGEGCLKKDDCYRHTALANPHRQSYFIESPIDKESFICKHFIDRRYSAANRRRK
jgi:hypothetical protein